MHRIGLLFAATLLILLSSCEKCMKCNYTYTVTSIQQTVNGEEEIVTTYTGYLKDTDSTYLQDECIKGDESFTIEQEYNNMADTTTLDDFTVNCTEL